MSHKEEFAILGTGCFWCTEAIFRRLAGVTEVESGYSGGHVENPSYEEVCGKKTGHAEVVKIQYNPDEISYKELLEVFWRVHDPTTPNQQGNDVGPQYRSAIFYSNEIQKKLAEESLKEATIAGIWKDPIVTELLPLINYFAAEDYHQKYLERVGDRNSYCTFVVKPKVKKFEEKFKNMLK